MTSHLNPIQGSGKGKLIEPKAMLLRNGFGSATAPDGTVYELSAGVQGSPMVKNETTGVTFSLSWTDLIEMAVAAGVNNAWPDAKAQKVAAPSGAAPETAPAHEGMTIAGDGASMLGKLMREQYASRGGVYPDGNPNAGSGVAS